MIKKGKYCWRETEDIRQLVITSIIKMVNNHPTAIYSDEFRGSDKDQDDLLNLILPIFQRKIKRKWWQFWIR